MNRCKERVLVRQFLRSTYGQRSWKSLSTKCDTSVPLCNIVMTVNNSLSSMRDAARHQAGQAIVSSPGPVGGASEIWQTLKYSSGNVQSLQ